MITRTIFIILLFAFTANAESKLIGHMVPLPSERLANPIVLQDECSGLIIYEWRGTIPSSKAVKRLNLICKRAVKAFPEFIKIKDLRANQASTFRYSIALLPDTNKYRGMNDMEYRFRTRFIQKELWAYTSKDQRYIFMISSVNIKEMPNIFSHELFHAMSIHYGIFDAHSDNNTERVRIDEKLAQDFTEYLVLGR